ncbi:MAG TPA: DNA gyrase inhibitor YacG [Steroidobacteraceae bacterium]|nr:DNA gyrase inhibitor YacG [Steroidobacteraceae bacterium]
MNAAARLACPTCKRPIEWSAEFPWRPFCSERCKLIDLGAWLTEKHAIPGEPVDESSAGQQETDPPANR